MDGNFHLPLQSKNGRSRSLRWGALPLEIIYLIFQHLTYVLFENKESSSRSLVRQSVSRLSLISSRVADVVRPLLFELLRLGVTDDIRVLFDIAWTPQSTWLSVHVTRFGFVAGCLPLPPLWAVLLVCLPSLQHLVLDVTESNDPPIISLWRQRPVLKKLASLHTYAPLDRLFLSVVLQCLPSSRCRTQFRGDSACSGDSRDVSATGAPIWQRRFFCTSSFSHIRKLGLI